MTDASPAICDDPGYRACSVKRNRRTKAAVEEIKSTIYDIVRADPPMTVQPRLGSSSGSWIY